MLPKDHAHNINKVSIGKDYHSKQLLYMQSISLCAETLFFFVTCSKVYVLVI